MKKFVALFSLLLILLCPLVGLTEQKIATITAGNGLRLREEPKLTSLVIMTMPYDKNVEIIGEMVDGFYPVRYAEIEGWASIDYLFIIDELSIAETTIKKEYILNTKTKKFHIVSCGSKPNKNAKIITSERIELIKQGYDPCKICKP